MTTSFGFERRDEGLCADEEVCLYEELVESGEEVELEYWWERDIVDVC